MTIRITNPVKVITVNLTSVTIATVSINRIYSTVEFTVDNTNKKSDSSITADATVY